MEFSEKLQQLRREKGLTQEQLAERLFVSRTAVSKWESGRGFPSIDSLRQIATCFSVSMDALLSGEEILSLAQMDQKRKEGNTRDLVCGLLDCAAAFLFFLPFFGQEIGGVPSAVSLLSLSGIQPYLKGLYLAVVTGLAVWGVLTLALQNHGAKWWVKSKAAVSLSFSVAGAFLFMIGRQPYAAALVFLFLVIKTFLLIKRR